MDPRTSRLDPSGDRYFAKVRLGESRSRADLHNRMAAEANAFLEQRAAAGRLSGHATMADYQSGEAIAARVEARAAQADGIAARTALRQPCGGCGVRYDAHEAFGCKRWRA
jgi:hypothetical protein